VTIRAQLEFIRDALADWARDFGGLALVASDPLDALVRLQQGPAKPVALAIFLGERPFSESSDRTFLVERTYQVALSRGTGLPATKSDSLMKETGARPAMYDLLESARDLIANLVFPLGEDEAEGAQPDPEAIPQALSIALWSVADQQALDIFRIEFTIVTPR